MKAASIESLHSDHREWESRIGLWRDDLRAWQHETREIQGQLERMLDDHQNELRTHASALRLHEESIAEHEHILAVCCATMHATGAIKCEDHRDEKAKQIQKHNEHELLKHTHHEMIGRLRRILKSFQEP